MYLSVSLGNLDTLLQPVCSQRDQPGNQLEVPWTAYVLNREHFTQDLSFLALRLE